MPHDHTDSGAQGAPGRRRCCGAGRGRGGESGRGRGALLEPAVLAALAGVQTHGYDVRRTVEEITAGAVVADPGGVYRVLRRLEEEGFATSAWAEGHAGPQRRAYSLTPAGLELLRHWLEHLERRVQDIGMVASAVRRVLEADRSQR